MELDSSLRETRFLRRAGKRESLDAGMFEDEKDRGLESIIASKLPGLLAFRLFLPVIRFGILPGFLDEVLGS